MIVFISLIALAFSVPSKYNLSATPTYYQSSMSLLLNLTLVNLTGDGNILVHFFIDYLPKGQDLPFALNRVVLNNTSIISPKESEFNKVSTWKLIMEVHSNAYYIWFNLQPAEFIALEEGDPNTNSVILNIDGLPILKRSRSINVRAFVYDEQEAEEAASEETKELITYTTLVTTSFNYVYTNITKSADKNTITIIIEPQFLYQNITLIEVTHDFATFGNFINVSTNAFSYTDAVNKRGKIKQITSSNTKNTSFQLISTATGIPILFKGRLIINMTYNAICNSLIDSLTRKFTVKLYQDNTLLETVNVCI